MPIDGHRKDSEDETAVPLLEVDLERERGGDASELEGRRAARTRDPNARRYREREDAFQPKYRKRTPLPLGQLVVLSGTRLAEPIAYTQIFPYINQMMEDLKVTDKPSEIGYYSGLVDSIFAVCQLFTILQWGRLSDRIGRKPVILLGLAGVALSSTLFGLARSLPAAIIARCLAGALSGNAAVVQSVVGEITDETNQAQAFPLTGLSWSLGCIIGPMIGGNFVNPAESFPNTFGRIQLLRDYPYLLPCLVSSALTVCAIIFGVIFMKESLPSKVRLDSSLPSPISAVASEKPVQKEELSVRQIIAAPAIRSIFKNYFLLSILGTSFDVVFILMAYTPVQLGGLSRSPEEIGYALAFSGLSGAVVQVFVFPLLQARFDDIPLYRGLMMLWPALYAFLPFLNVAARWTMPAGVALGLPSSIANSSAVVAAVNGTVGSIVDDAALAVPVGAEEVAEWFPAGWLVWVSIALALAILRIAHMSYSLNVILIKNAAPSKEALGSTFGLAQTVACFARAGAPAFVSSLFAVSKKYQLMGGNFVWAVMFGVALLGLWSTYQVRDAGVERGWRKTEEECEMRML